LVSNRRNEVILIDRRKSAKGKSSTNRHKLIRRVKSFIKASAPQNIGQGGVAGQNAQATSPVNVAGSALEEPWFAYANDGDRTAVIIGNTEYDRGDEVVIPDGEGSGGKGAGAGSGGASGEDDFIINIARDEYLDLFFEDCELPNLVNEKYTDKLDNKFAQAGFSTTGSPSQLSIVRTFKQALGRRKAMSAPHQEEKEQLEAELKTLVVPNEIARVEWIQNRLLEIDKKLLFIRSFDSSDMRYRKREAKPLKTVDAVIFLLMDISGSMTEEKKTIARRWFALLYAFIKRRYPDTELVFIAHTDDPFEMSENDFFSTRVNGGTTVSPALELVNKIILERYDPNQTNIYISHASDGDNHDDDNPAVVDQLLGKSHLLNKIQLFSYVEVGKPGGWFSVGRSEREDSGLWESYDKVRLSGKSNDKKVTLALIQEADECYKVFRSIFKKAKS
jgi:uncharacterized sporulation protein YeaH/YhbH (DUF444 family)